MKKHKNFRYDLLLIIAAILLIVNMILVFIDNIIVNNQIQEAQEMLLNSESKYIDKQIEYIENYIADREKHKSDFKDQVSIYVSVISSITAITSLIVAIDNMSKKQDFLRNYPKLLLKNVIIKENNNPKTDWKEYENVGAMDISDYKELYYIDLTKSQYRNYVKGKYIPSGQSVSFSNNISDDDCIFKYIQIAATVEHKYVVLSDGYYRLERQDHNKYVVIQKSLTYYSINKDKYDKSSTVITTEMNIELLKSLGVLTTDNKERTIIHG